MSIALYRKYRPETFADVVGQDHIVSVLSKSLSNGGVSHAYLFAGPRGLGKTSIARILAREIGTTPRDLYEIDAASNRGIDDIRALREEVAALPFESPYKVYIIDEVHMLTKEAFNALLKTLEEPPQHAKFVLATTEMHKLPDTIISRCEVHRFNQPDTETLAAHVQAVAKKEGYDVDDEAAQVIARAGNGSYRDTLGVLQKALGAVEGKKVMRGDIEKVLGQSEALETLSLLQAIHGKDLSKALEEAKNFPKDNASFMFVLERLIEDIRFVLLARHGKPELLPEMSPDKKEMIETMAKEAATSGVNSKTLARFLDLLSRGTAQTSPHLSLELALIDTLEEK